MPKRGCLGCSFPVIVGLLVVFIGLFVVGFIVGPIGSNMLGELALGPPP